MLLYGVVGTRNAYAVIDDGQLHARFGFFSVSMAIADIERWQLSGPYRWWRAIGMRWTVGKPEITFGGSAHGGIVVALHRPIPRWWWIRNLRRVYLTLDDLDGFATELERRGISGEDVRRPAERKRGAD